MKPSHQRCGDSARRCRGCGRRSRESPRSIQRPGILHSPRLEIRREVGDTTDVLGGEKTCCWLDKVDGVAVGSIFDSIILELTQKLQTFVEFEAMTENLSDLEIVGIDRQGNAGTTLGACRFTGVEFDLRSVEVRVSLFVDKIEFIVRSRGVVPEDFIRSNPRIKEFPSGFVVLGDEIRLPENIVANIDRIWRVSWVDASAIGVCRLFRFRRNNRVVGFEVVEHPCFDKIHGCRSGVVVDDRIRGRYP